MMKAQAVVEESMTEPRRLGYSMGFALLLIVMVVTTVHSQEAADDYVAPSQAVPKGAAPGMQVQLLSGSAAGGETKEYALILAKGDEVFSGLQAFAEKYHVTSAHFTAIGALSGATLAWFDPQRKMYKKFPI